MAETFYELQKNGIYKKLLHGGKGPLPNFVDGSKAFFHYRTTKVDEEKTLLDDSRHVNKPLELIFGKKFKLDVWETCLKTMKINEVAEFTCEIKHTAVYPVVMKSLRDIYKGKSEHGHSSHCCGMMALSDQGTGYPDLNLLMKNPEPLIFTLELIKLEMPESYEQESWSMNENEKLTNIPLLKEKGNMAYKNKDYEEASQKYAQALTMLEDLMLQEKPGDEEWKQLDDIKRPILLNFCQCKLLAKDYYPVITHTTQILETDPDNIKALFRRAKANAAVWNVSEAREDFHRVAELDPTLEPSVAKELLVLDTHVKAKNQQEKSRLKGMFS